MSNVYQQLAQAILDLTPPPGDDTAELVAYLGYTPAGGTYTIRVGSSPVLVWVRVVKGQERWPTQAYNFGNVPLVPDLPVRVQAQKNRLVILGLHRSAVEFLGTNVPNVVGEHSHEPGFMMDPVSPRRLKMGLIHAYKESGVFTMRVYIEPLWYVWEGRSQRWPGGTLDLTGYVPPTGLQRWVKVGLQPVTNTPVAAGGIPAALNGTLSLSSLAAIPLAGSIPLCGVKLIAGQTVINDEWTFEDCSPWRSGAGFDLLSGKKHNLAASAAPTSSDDETAGYSLGSWWFDTLADEAYVCVDARGGLAVWKQVAGGGSGWLTGDASAVTYTPAQVADWDGSADPGHVDGALDQLAGRVADLETTGGGNMLQSVYDPNADGRVSLAVEADTVDGQHASAFAASSHNHTGVYAPLAHNHDDRYFTAAAHRATSAGAADAGQPIVLNAAGQVDSSMLPAGNAVVHMALLYFAGTLEPGASPLRIYNATGQAKTISKVFLACDTAPTGAAIICDVHKNGVTIFTTQAHRPQIPAGTNTGVSTSIDVTTWAADEYLTAHIDQVGSIVAGEDLVLHLVYA